MQNVKLPKYIKLNQNRLAVISLSNPKKSYQGYKLWIGDRYAKCKPLLKFNEYLYGTLIPLWYQDWGILQVDLNFFKQNANVQDIIGLWHKNYSILAPLYKKAIKEV
ncbi:MAG: hypothetical protein NTY22_07530 [Proteobacteria bacterium]|nr:hypothetical protein [Pseudomonadota bacterium]